MLKLQLVKPEAVCAKEHPGCCQCCSLSLTGGHKHAYFSSTRRILQCAGGPCSFSACFKYAESNFLALVTSVPELVEKYETVDGNGASVRRYMINDPDSHLEPDSAFEQHSKSTRQPDQQQEQKNEVSKQIGAASGQQQVASKTAAQDLAYMERRYRSSFTTTTSQGDFSTFSS